MGHSQREGEPRRENRSRALVQRLIRALCPPGGLVADCFAGTASAGVAALIEGRSFIGCDINAEYVAIGNSRLGAYSDGTLKYRSIDRAPFIPGSNDAVATPPSHFIGARIAEVQREVAVPPEGN